MTHRAVLFAGDKRVGEFADADAAFHAACDIQSAGPTVGLAFAFGPSPDDTANLCARLVGMADAGQVLTTQQTIEALSPGLRSRFRRLYAINLDAPLGEVTVCEATGAEGDASDITTKLSHEMLAPKTRWALKLTYAGASYTIEPGGSVRLGRDKSNDVVIESALASRVHARVYEREGKFVIVDESSNGTFVRHDGHINEITLRREEGALGERGWIGLGRPASTHGDHILRYRLERRGG
jgi:hypothetical protein